MLTKQSIDKLLALETEKWAKQKAQVDLDYKFELLKKYDELHSMGYRNAAIKKLITEMASIINQVKNETSSDEEEE